MIITRDSKGQIVVIGEDIGDRFVVVEEVKRLGLYEAAMRIEDLNTQEIATNAVGKANMSSNSAMISKLRDRVIHVLQQQRRN